MLNKGPAEFIAVSIYNIGTKPRKYELVNHNDNEERRQLRPTGNSVAYRKWFTGKPKTIERGAQNLRQYCEWLGKTPEQLKVEYRDARKSVDDLDDWKRETKQSILKYYNESKEKGYKINACRTQVTGVLAFYSQNCESIKGVVKQLDPVQIPENDFVFDQPTLRKMYYYGSPFEKTWLSCAVGLGYASADFLALETEKIINLIAEARDKQLDFMMFIGKTRTKTSVQPRSFLTPESRVNLEEYLKTLDKESNGRLPKLLWKGATNDNLNDWLKALMKTANIETYGKNVKFHGLRKFLYDTLARMDETIASVVTAKKTDASKITYRTSLDSECARIFKESYKLFALNGDVSGKAKLEQAKEIENLKIALKQVETENIGFKTRLELLHENSIVQQKQMEEIIAQNKATNEKIDQLYPKHVSWGYYDQKTNKSMLVTENYNSVDEYLGAKKKYESMPEDPRPKKERFQEIIEMREKIARESNKVTENKG